MDAIISGEGPEDTSGSVYSCARCGHRWVTRKSNGPPKSCPRCRSIVWNKDFHVCECLKCGRRWGSTSKRPSRCPGCQTTKWDNLSGGYNSGRAVRRIMISRVPPELKKEVNRLYNSGVTLLKIAIRTGISFGDVFSVVSAAHPGKELSI